MGQYTGKEPWVTRVVWDYGEWRVENVYPGQGYEVVETYPTKREALNRAETVADVWKVPINVYRKDETPSIKDPQRIVKKYAED